MENSSASGIFYCVAFNKVGEEERSIEFYVSGKQKKNPKKLLTTGRCCCSDCPEFHRSAGSTPWVLLSCFQVETGQKHQFRLVVLTNFKILICYCEIGLGARQA